MENDWVKGSELAEEAIKSEGLEFAEKHLVIMERVGSNSEDFISGFRECVEHYEYFQEVNGDKT